MSEFTPVSHDEPCEICGRTNGYCKTKLDERLEEKILYHFCSQVEANKGDRINDYDCVGNTGSGWTTFVHKDDSRKPNTKKTKEEIVDKLLSDPKVSAKDKASVLEQLDKLSLSADERHTSYSRIFVPLKLDNEDKSDLEWRGFTEQQIEQCGFKSYDGEFFKEWKKDKFDLSYQSGFSVTHKLPGVNRDGDRFRVKGGILLPILNPQGKITGAQIRLREPFNEIRYLWLSGGNDQILKLPGVAENPLAVHRPSETAIGFGLCEGVGVKPFLTSQRLNLNIIGAAGGQFLSSPKLLQQYLEELQAESGLTKKITIFPDAGDILDEKIVNRWLKIAEMIRLWGWKVDIAWWEQETKEHDDIDELSPDSYQSIEHLKPKKFYQLSKRLKGQRSADDKKREDEAQLATENALYKSLTELDEVKLQELGIEIVKINKEWLDPEDLHLEKGVICLNLSYKGSGKSKSCALATVQYDNIYSWHNRIALERAMAAILSLQRIELRRNPVVAKNNLLENSPRNLVTFCSNSSFQFHPEKLSKNGLLLLDEIDQVAAYNFEKLCNSDGIRPIILNSLEAQINAALADGIVLGMSADISLKEIEYIKKIAPPETKIRLVINEYKPQRGTMFFSLDKTPDAMIGILIQKLENGIPCFVMDDIKGGVRGCRSIASYVRQYFEGQGKTIRILEVSSDTSGEKNVIKVLENINEESLNYDLIICTPSVTSGISITNQRFVNGVFGFFAGILNDCSASQSLVRVRGAKELHVWVAESGFNFERSGKITPVEVNEFYKRDHETRNKFLMQFNQKYSPLIKEWSSPHWDLFCKNSAYQNLIMRRLRYHLKNKFIEDGYQIQEKEFGESKEIEEGLKDSWWNVQEGDAWRIEEVELLEEFQIDVLKDKQKKESLTIEEKCQINKYYLHRNFGEKLIRSAQYNHKNGHELLGYAAMCLLNWDRKLEQGLFNFYRVSRPIQETIEHDLNIESDQLKHGQNIQRFPADTRNKTRLHKFVESFGLEQFLKVNHEFYPNEFKPFTQRIKANAKAVKQVLGFNPENLKDGQIFTEVMQRFGLRVETCDVVLNGVKQRWKSRKITLESWSRAQMFVEYREELRLEREARDAEWQLQQEEKRSEEADRQLTANIAKTKDSIRQKFEKYTYQDSQLFTTESLKDCVDTLNDCEDRETLDGVVIGWRALFRTKEKVNDFIQLLAENFLKEKTLQFAEWLTPTQRQMNLFEEGEEVYELASDETIEFIDAQIGKLPSNQEELWTRRIDAACKIGVDIGLQCFHKAENFYQSIAKSLPTGSSWKALFNKIVMGITQESIVLLSE